MAVTGSFTDLFNVSVCNIFKETMLDGQLCYQADLDRIRDQVDEKMMVTEGFVFLLDYNEDRNVKENDDDKRMEGSTLLCKKEEHDDALIYVETVGKNNNITYRISSLNLNRNVPNISFLLACMIFSFNC